MNKVVDKYNSQQQGIEITKLMSSRPYLTDIDRFTDSNLDNLDSKL